MSEHIFDEIPRLFTGEADRQTVHDAAAHLRGCVDCRDELVSALVAHASLSSAVRFAPEIVSRPDSVPSDVPAPLSELPDLSTLLARARSEADEAPAATRVRTPEPTAPKRRHLRGQIAVAAAVTGVALGSAGVYAYDRAQDHGRTTTFAVSAYASGTVDATGSIIDGRKITIDASRLPALGSQRFYEVWLTDAQRQRMAAVGQLDDARKGSFSVPASTVSHYSAVEVTVQDVGGAPEPSKVSVLRGSYR